MPRRKPGAILSLEYSVLAAITELQSSRADAYGYSIAAMIAQANDEKTLTSHGTLYKALGRMVEAGLLSAEWEAPDSATDEGRPRRRVYEVTAEGARAHVAWVEANRRANAPGVAIARVVGA
jgi:DNA-binding PadR family transcriptional regulator